MAAERAIRIEADGVRLYAVLTATETSQAVWSVLPLEGSALTWGQEIYFYISLEIPLEPEARAEVRPGDIGFWPEGPAIALFYGPTPASGGSPDPVAASPVNVFGRITGDASRLAKVREGCRIRITRLEG